MKQGSFLWKRVVALVGALVGVCVLISVALYFFGGPVFYGLLVLVAGQDTWDQALVDQFLQSIRCGRAPD